MLFTPASTLTSTNLDQKRNTFEQDDEGNYSPPMGRLLRRLPYRTLARQDTGLGVRPRSGRAGQGKAGQKHEMTGQDMAILPGRPTTSSPSQTHEATWSNEALLFLALASTRPVTNQWMIMMQSKACGLPASWLGPAARRYTQLAAP